MKRVVVDANIAFRALAGSRGNLRCRLESAENICFIAPRFLFVELFKHKDRLVHASRKSEEEVLASLHALVASMDFADETAIPVGTWLEAAQTLLANGPEGHPLRRRRAVSRRGVVDRGRGTDDRTSRTRIHSLFRTVSGQ